ncbi:MAG TPA: NAD-dependent epimerase/dehydratase family protein [Acidimicrobiales bacterium]|nr:NAD-dependent epimerase/dehydratase family protein [Acidimicrobiales bacterium]
MRVVVTGATGNLGTSVLAALAEEPAVESVVGVARRRPDVAWPKVAWRSADVTGADLSALFAGADAVVHLAWIVQPNHDERALQRVNVEGTLRVLDAVAVARVPVLVSESAFGAYSAGPSDRVVDESWPTHGLAGSWYSRQKAYVERALDAFELAHPEVRAVRFRSAYVLKREAAAQAHRLYGGPLLPHRLARPGRLPAIPFPSGMRFQAVHSLDVGQAYRRALVADVRGPFNLAAEPVLDAAAVASAMAARPVPVPPGLVRAAAAAAWHLRLQPTSPDWVELLVRPTLLDARRAGEELGWSPVHTATAALAEFLDGVADGAGGDTPPLLPLDRARPSFRP